MEVYFKNREEWRKWLEENSCRNKGLWMIIYKKHTGRECVRYNEAVEEALCFGWIDGKIKRVNDEYFIQWYTRRRRGSRWSKYNIGRVEKMMKEGKMTPEGVKAYREIYIKPNLIYDNRSSGEPEIPGDLLSALEINKTALHNFLLFSSSSRRLYIDYLNSAKRDKTRIERIRKIVSFAEQNKRPGLI